MNRALFSTLAIVAVTATLAGTSAQAQSFKKRSGWQAGNAANFKAPMRQRRMRAKRQRVRGLTNGTRRPAANTAAHIHALTVYLQWRRKCLDNILPQCP